MPEKKRQQSPFQKNTKLPSKQKDIPAQGNKRREGSFQREVEGRNARDLEEEK